MTTFGHWVNGEIEYNCCSGWTRASNCKEMCVHGYYGYDCMDTCDCPGGFTCNHVDGSCGLPSCEDECINNRHCNNDTKVCECMPGWQGDACNKPCQKDFYGQNCNQTCVCVNHVMCDNIDGQCICNHGWTGATCNKTCDAGFYGIKCEEVCNCSSVATCDPINGTCFCPPGLYGDRVNDEIEYSCCSGWTRASNCKEMCVHGYYGYDCMDTCDCPGGFTCNHVDGSCGLPSCEDECINNRHCNNDTKVCECMPGWQGDACNKPCQKDFYGQNCNQTCVCVNHVMCDNIDGQCICNHGWTGATCNKTCDAGFYGIKCEEVCNCSSVATCDPINGTCFCPPGLFGDRCQTCDPVTVDCKGKMQDSTKALALGVTVSISAITLFLIILVLGAAVMLWKRRIRKRHSLTMAIDEPADQTLGDHELSELSSKEPQSLQMRVEELEVASGCDESNHPPCRPTDVAMIDEQKVANPSIEDQIKEAVGALKVELPQIFAPGDNTTIQTGSSVNYNVTINLGHK